VPLATTEAEPDAEVVDEPVPEQAASARLSVVIAARATRDGEKVNGVLQCFIVVFMHDRSWWDSLKTPSAERQRIVKRTGNRRGPEAPR
jgi:hypothetical protein